MRFLAIGFNVCILSICAAVVSLAGGLEDGKEAYRRGDYRSAMEAWRPLAEQGDAEAIALIGLLYHLGEGVPQDYEIAASLLRSAAEKGDAFAAYMVGDAFNRGEGRQFDPAAAAKWFKVSAEKGNVLAQYELGRLLAIGQGVPQDFVRAHMWMNLAAAKMDLVLPKFRKRAAQARDAIAAQMTPEQVAEAQKLAREWEPVR